MKQKQASIIIQWSYNNHNNHADLKIVTEEECEGQKRARKRIQPNKETSCKQHLWHLTIFIP